MTATATKTEYGYKTRLAVQAWAKEPDLRPVDVQKRLEAKGVAVTHPLLLRVQAKLPELLAKYQARKAERKARKAAKPSANGKKHKDAPNPLAGVSAQDLLTVREFATKVGGVATLKELLSTVQTLGGVDRVGQLLATLERFAA